MRDIYQRLKRLGFDAPFLKSRILPDWWDDAQAEVPATRAIAEFAISKLLGIPIEALQNPRADLPQPSTAHALLKLRSDATRKRVTPGLALADRAARLVVDLLTEGGGRRNLRAFTGERSAVDVRSKILAKGQIVALDSLLDFAWSNGIVVIHLAGVPTGSRAFDGMACFMGNVPVVVLASARQSPPWLAFHLGHELGHILLGHARPGGESVVDAGLDGESDDAQEREADRFALKVLAGTDDPVRPGTASLTGPKLAAWAVKTGNGHRIEPGFLALCAGRALNRIPAAQGALKELRLDVGAHAMVAERLAAHVPDGLPEDLERLLAPEPATA